MVMPQGKKEMEERDSRKIGSGSLCWVKEKKFRCILQAIPGYHAGVSLSNNSLPSKISISVRPLLHWNQAPSSMVYIQFLALLFGTLDQYKPIKSEISAETIHSY